MAALCYAVGAVLLPAVRVPVACARDCLRAAQAAGCQNSSCAIGAGLARMGRTEGARSIACGPLSSLRWPGAECAAPGLQGGMRYSARPPSRLDLIGACVTREDLVLLVASIGARGEVLTDEQRRAVDRRLAAIGASDHAG